MTKKELLENSIFDKFKKSYNPFPQGKIDHIDKPDFIIHSNKKIGVEITQIFKDQESKKGSLLKSVEEITKKVSEEIIFLLNKNQKPKCYISVHLNENEFPSQLSPKEIAEYCFSDIDKNINVNQKNYILEIHNNGQLPILVDSYEVIFNEKVKDFEYIESYSTLGGVIDNSGLQYILDKKEEAKREFIKCDEYWLIIKSGEFSADYFPSIEINPKELKTSFDKIFILKYLENEVIEIK
jgi:hypothetical protein